MSLIETFAGIAVPQAAVPLRLLAWARASGNWLLVHPMATIALAAVAFGGLEHHEAQRWADLARQRGLALAAVQSANARAVQQATAAKDLRDAYNSKLAVDSDRTAADLRDRYHAAVVQLAAAQDRARRSDLPGHANAPASSDRPGESAGFPAGSNPAGESPRDRHAVVAINSLAISEHDALTCADNTARLQAVHDWAVALGE